MKYRPILVAVLCSLFVASSALTSWASGGGRDADLMPAPERDAVEAGMHAAESGVPPYDDLMFAQIAGAQRYVNVATAALISDQTKKTRYLSIWCKGEEPECAGVWYNRHQKIQYTFFSNATFVDDGIEITIDADPPRTLQLIGSRKRTRRDILYTTRQKRLLQRLASQIELGYCGR